jgi:CIC family chloride channel protein
MAGVAGARLARALSNLRLTDGRRLLLLAVLIGICTGLLVVCFHATIELIEGAVRGARLGPLAGVLVPAAGAALAAAVVHVVPASRGSGIVQTKAAIYVSNGQIPAAAIPGKFAACALSLGTGTPLGPEDPSLLMGAGLASRLGHALGLSRRSMRQVAPVGAAAGISAAFNTPITGVLFVMEEVLEGWDAAVLGTIVLAATAAVVTTRMFLGESPLFRVPDIAAIATPREALVYVLLGVAAGLAATLYVRGIALLRGVVRPVRLPVGVAPLLAGLLVGVVGLWLPEVLGTGYRTMDAAMHGQYPWTTMALLGLVKLALAALAFGVQTPGGLFAPTLFIGVMLGGTFAGLLPDVLPLDPGPHSMLALAGTAGLFAGVFRGPMTAIFMTFELSGTSAAIVPAMITAILGHLVARQLHRQSMLDLVAVEEGAMLPSARLRRPDEPLRVEDALSPSMGPADGLLPTATVADALAALAGAQQECAVVRLGPGWGVVERAALEAAVAVGGAAMSLDTIPTVTRVDAVYPDELVDVALRQFAVASSVPVVSRLDPRHLLGVLTLADVRRAFGVPATRWSVDVRR